MFYRGKSVEVIVGALEDEALSMDALRYYHRSDYMMIVRSGYAGKPYKSLKNVDPLPLFDFPGHGSVREDWFKKLLLYDSGQYDLMIEADLWENVTDAYNKHFGDQQGSVYESGQLIVKAGTKIVVGEAGLVWSPDPNSHYDQMLVAWEFIVDLKLLKKS